MKGLALLAGFIATLVQMPAYASGDGVCGFSDADCGMPALPYLLPDNDTRTNLVLLQSSRNHIPLPIPQPEPDQTRSRVDPFTAYRVMGLAATEDNGDSAQTDTPADPGAPADDKAEEENASLLQKAVQLHFPDTELSTLRDLTPVDLDGRWVSNDLTTLEGFFDLLLADKELNDAQRTQLALVRMRMLSSEYGVSDANTDVAGVPDAGHAGELRRYLASSVAFYEGQLDQADKGFQQLLPASQPWVAETARYMLIRVSINQAMKDAQDEYNMFDPRKMDKRAGKQAVQRIDDYLKQYPRGNYADSAEGLYRRAEWISGDTVALARRFSKALASAKSVDQLQAISNEIDNKLLEDNQFVISTDTPVLMLVQDIKRLRSPDGWMALPALTQEEITRQQPLFEKAGMQEEFRYLQAAFYYYLQRDYAAVLKTLPMTTAEDITGVTAFSVQVLRGLAMQQQKQWDDAEAQWRHLLMLKTTDTQQQFLQLTLAQTLVDSGHPERVFTPESPVKNLRFRSAILKVSADAELLHRQTGPQQTHEERAIALHTLLTKRLTHRDYAGFLKDGAQLKTIAPLKSTENMSWNEEDLTVFDWDGSDTEEGYECPTLQETVTTLSQNASDAHALNCLGEFVLRTGNGVGFDWGESNMLNGLTDAAAQYPGQEFNRLDNYMQVIADAKASPEDKSYALYRAIYCYAPSGYNDCGSQDISKETRKAWFRQLKTDFKGSQWARQLKYYW
ncbi:hypothetical protein [Dickeya dianthicola]|uniref:hypothetical protein n=1 Tax=Dickeya dianthicola TaxID=204039 RepID=UPI00136C8C87|nr:hypothetical protein [Dickeya dianthicola]MCI4236568.1 hypothetical protein [Dickeya dianthicola]MCI4254751.1 hypothetical protein [Dickeya dianthicola]MZG21578.1 hypothetical protein [Dickeya dianthicola]